MREGVTDHSEVQTFERRPAAAAWIRNREMELAESGALEKLKEPQSTLADAIDRYIEESRKAIGRTKPQVLEKVKEEFEIAKMPCKTSAARRSSSLPRSYHRGDSLRLPKVENLDEILSIEILKCCDHLVDYLDRRREIALREVRQLHR